MYRVEVNFKNIGTELETPFSLNPTRLRFSHDSVEWQLLSTLVDISLQNNISLFNVCNAAVQQRADVVDYLPGIWEVLFERARPDNVPLKRTQCAFFFEKKENASLFKDSYPGMAGGLLCKVEILEEWFSMRADMKWLDNIDENKVNAAEAIAKFQKYWAGEMTAEPVVEVLFTGRYKLNPVEA